MLACTILKYLCTVLQVALAAAIIGIVAAQLHNVTFTADFGASTAGGTPQWGIHTHASCSLGTAVESTSLCTYTYVLAGLSLLISALISLVKCVTCDLCGLGGLLDIIFSVVGTCWWAVGASVVTKHVQEAASADLPLQQWRDAVMAMAWAEVGMFGALIVAGTCGCASKLCCGRRGFEKL